MFKASDVSDGSDVIILDHLEPIRFQALRRKARADQLRCPVCRQPVWVKSGTNRVSHFAHKHLADCPTQSESAELLQARAALYRWLRAKFGDSVTVEHIIAGSNLQRHIDCWVERSSTSLAYWIFDAQMRPDERSMLRNRLEDAGAKPVFIFLASMMRRNERPRDVLNLTTTERQFVTRTAYDAPYTDWANDRAGSLHYIDAEAHSVTTFRAMCCIESPQQHAGTELKSALPDLLVKRTDGQFVHAGETDRLSEWRTQEKARQAEAERRMREAADAARRQEDARRANREAWERARRERLSPGTAYGMSNSTPSPATEPRTPSPLASPLIMSENKEGLCLLCGERTRDWYYYDGAGNCKCNDCLRRSQST
jgi:hypothetical protein